MLTSQECGLVPPASPVKPVRRPPALLRRHPPEDGELLRAGLFILWHGETVRSFPESGKTFTTTNRYSALGKKSAANGTSTRTAVVTVLGREDGLPL